MNKYPEWWDTSITVYNKFTDPTSRQITWYRHVLSNCFWKYTGNKVIIGETTLDTNSTICRVPIDTNFKEKHTWETSDRTTYFTFGPGDIIVREIVTDEIDEYVQGQRSTDLITKYKKLQGCFVIEKYSLNVGPGRGMEHYYVRGI